MAIGETIEKVVSLLHLSSFVTQKRARIVNHSPSLRLDSHSVRCCCAAMVFEAKEREEREERDCFPHSRSVRPEK